jgi:hypothetical protein
MQLMCVIPHSAKDVAQMPVRNAGRFTASSTRELGANATSIFTSFLWSLFVSFLLSGTVPQKLLSKCSTTETAAAFSATLLVIGTFSDYLRNVNTNTHNIGVHF